MDDVKPNEEAIPQAEPTAEQPSQAVEQAPVTPVDQTPHEEAVERQVPISVVQKERKLRQDAQRELASLRSQNQLSQFDATDTEAIMSHPIVQQMFIKQAKQELTDFTREQLDNYPTVPEQVKKAILKNVRGFVNEDTTDTETAKADILDYIESLVDEAAPTVQAKGFPVAVTNVPVAPAVNNSAVVDKIQQKPITEWTEEDTATVEEYLKNLKK
jgi:hypothetical protein